MKKRSLKILSTLVGVTMLTAALLTGCGSKTSPGSAEAPQGTSSNEISGTITYWSHDNTAYVAANKKLIEDFQKQYPKVKVNYQYFPYDALMNKLKAAYAGKNESDVQQIFGSWATYYMKNGLFDEVPADMSADVKANYYAAPVGGYSFNGKLYGIPREVNVENGGVLYYPEKLKSVGFDKFPSTYEELIDAAKKLTKTDASGNIVNTGFDIVSYDNLMYTFLSFILQQGGSYWADDKVHVKFTNPEAQKAMQAIADLFLTYKVTDMKHSNNLTVDSYTYFFQGKSAMTYRGPWTIAAGKDEFKLNNFDYAPMPSFTGSSKAFASEPGWGEVVSSRSKNKAAAWAFVKFITNPENSKYFNIQAYQVPAIKANAESPDFLKAQPMFKPIIDILNEGQPIGQVYDVDKLKTTINTHIQRIVDGKEDVNTALVNIEKEANTVIDQNK